MRTLVFWCVVGLVAGCSRPPVALVSPVASDSATPAAVAAPTPMGTPAVSAWTSEDEGAQLHFESNFQWYTPKSWTGDGSWLTPDGVLVKFWLVSRGEKQLDSAEVARLFEVSSEMTHLKVGQAPAAEAQDDFHLWMFSGSGQKKNARHQVESVVWQACLVEPLHPVRVGGPKIFTAIGPPGSQAKCREALLKLTRTIERSKNGALPPRIKVSFTPGP